MYPFSLVVSCHSSNAPHTDPIIRGNIEVLRDYVAVKYETVLVSSGKKSILKISLFPSLLSPNLRKGGTGRCAMNQNLRA